LQNALIHWEVDGVAQPTLTLSNPLGAGQSQEITLGTFDFSGGNVYSIIAYTSEPNGISDVNYMNDTTMVEVNVYPTPEVNLGPDVSLCEGETVLLDAGLFSTYIWTPTNSVQTFLVSTTGTYQVTVTDNNGCMNSDTIDVIVNPLPIINMGNDTVLLANESIVITAPPGYQSYLWSTGETSQFIIIDSTGIGLNTVTFWIEVTDANGCAGYDEFDIGFIFNAIDETYRASTLGIYPNPTSGIVTFTTSDVIGLKDVVVADIFGKVVYSKQLIEDTTLDLKYLSKGVYLIKVLCNDKYFVGKVILY